MQTSAQGPGADSSGAMADWAPMLPLPPIIGPRAPVPPKRVVEGGALLVGSSTALAAAYCLTAHGSYLGVGWFLGYALLVGVIPPLVAVRNLWWVQSLEGGWRARRFRAALILWVITMITGPVLVLGLRLPAGDLLSGPYLWVAAPQVTLFFLALSADRVAKGSPPWRALAFGLPLAIPAFYWALMLAWGWGPGNRVADLEQFTAGLFGNDPRILGHFYPLVYELVGFAVCDLVAWGWHQLRP